MTESEDPVPACEGPPSDTTNVTPSLASATRQWRGRRAPTRLRQFGLALTGGQA